MEIATLVLSIVAALVTAITQAVQSNDWSVLDKPVREVLPSPLRITVERHRAEAEAAAKFGGGHSPASKLAELPANPYDAKATAPAPDHIEQFFAYAHLPPHLAEVSKPFADLAAQIAATVPRNPERTVALRKLLEAKDAAVRARIAK